MFIPIPIPPIGNKAVITLQGAVWKLVRCRSCSENYAYQFEVEATGEGENLLFLDGAAAAERALTMAEERFARKSQNTVLPVPCPNCGCYQDEMSNLLKEKASMNSLQITGAVLLGLSLAAFAFNIPYYWIISTALAVLGVVLLFYGYLIAFRFDANRGDPELRKAFGRKHALWGEQLAKFLASNPIPEAIDLSDPTGIIHHPVIVERTTTGMGPL
jgi:hypothetical protein